MKILPINRKLNILTEALKAGFEINDEYTAFNDLVFEAEEYLLNYCTFLHKEEVEINSVGNHGQTIQYSDGMGYEYFEQGEIVHFSEHCHKDKEIQIPVTTIVNSLGETVELYYTVGETEYNVPDGFYFDQKTKSHIKYSDNEDF